MLNQNPKPLGLKFKYCFCDRCLLIQEEQSSNCFFFPTKFYSLENSAHSLFSRFCLTQERTCVLNFQHESSPVKSNVYVYISTYMSTYALLSTRHFSQHRRLVRERLAEKLKNSYTTMDSPQSLHFLIFSLSLPCSCYLHTTVFWSKSPPTTVFPLLPQVPICLKDFCRSVISSCFSPSTFGFKTHIPEARFLFYSAFHRAKA